MRVTFTDDELAFRDEVRAFFRDQLPEDIVKKQRLGVPLAFLAAEENQQRSIWLRPLDSGESRVLPGTAGAWFPFWSPDGKSIGFFADGKMKRALTAVMLT